MRPIFLTLAALLFALPAAAEQWDGAYGSGYENLPPPGLPSWQAQGGGVRQQASYVPVQPPQPVLNYQQPAIPDYLPETRAKAQQIAGQQAYAQQPLYATTPQQQYGQQPAYAQQPQTYAAPAYQQQPTYQQPAAQPQYAAPQPQYQAQQYQAQPYQQQAYAAPAYQAADAYPQQYQQTTTTTQTYVTQPAQQAYAYETVPQAPATQVEAQPAYAAEPRRVGSTRGWYLSLKSGITIPDESDYTIGGAPIENEYKTGWALDSAIGYAFPAWSPWLAPRAEFELGYMRNSIDSHTIGGTKFSDPAAFGDASQLSFLVNGYLDFYMARYLQPYIGGGFGLAYVDLDRQGTNPTGVIMDNDAVGFAWDAGAGLNFPLGYGMLLDLGWRYQQAVDLEMTSVGGSKSDVTLGNHVITLGLRSPL